MRHLISLLTAILCALSLLWSAGTSRADSYICNSFTSSGDWNSAIWKLNGSGSGVGPPTSGNTYQMIARSVPVYPGSSSYTTVRTPTSSGNNFSFPGDSLTVSTNADLKFKRLSSASVNPITANFPGVNGNPGLIIDGGVIDIGNDTYTFNIDGKISVPSAAFLSLSSSHAGGPNMGKGIAFNIVGQLSGAGTIYILSASLTNVLGGSVVGNPQQVSGTANTFTGNWVVMCGWLQGVNAGSLGTGSVTVDPNFPLSNYSAIGTPSSGVAAFFEPMYDVNSRGVLTLTNGGRMDLHQNCTYNSIVINGTSLSPGPHSYAELAASFPNNIVNSNGLGVVNGGTGSLTVQFSPPHIVTAPVSQVLYAGITARFSVTATPPLPLLSYQWRTNGVNLGDGGKVLGSTTAALTVNNLSAAEAASYDVVVTNAGGSVTSSVAVLTVLAPNGAYQTAAVAANPVAFYEFSETGDPATNNTVAFDNMGGNNGLYGTAVQNGNATYGIAGPVSADGFAGFPAGNTAALFTHGTGASRVSVPGLNLNTNTVTLTAWIKPSAPTASAGLVFCRSGTTAAGLNYSSATDLGGNYELGYNWNNEWETYSWASGLVPPLGQWSFVALVVTPTNATIHLMNASGLASATHTYAHVPQAFAGTILIGDDAADNGNGANVFSGTIDEVAIFNSALTKSQLTTLFYAASGASSYAPIIAAQPVSQGLYAGQTAQFTVAAGGSDPLSYQWQAGASGGGIYTNLTDDGRILGSSTATLSLGNIGAADQADYVVIITNSAGSITSSVATLLVLLTGPPENITASTQQGTGGPDWNTPSFWSDGNPASLSAVEFPGSTYELLPHSRMRTPQNPRTAIFPGNILTVDGNGVWVNDPGSSVPTAEIRFNNPVPGTVFFKKLVMNGGQLDVSPKPATGNGGLTEITGEIDIVTNTALYGDSTYDAGFTISAWLTGSAPIEYHAYNQSSFMSSYVNCLNIAGTSNTFSGRWNVVLGVLLGTAPNALGTNDIIVGSKGALETTYNLNNTNANLFLSGKMYLHQNDAFGNVFVGGTQLVPGTYTFAQLSSSYPAYFPATWTPQSGATSFSTGSGSITVVSQTPAIQQQPAPVTSYPGPTVQFTVTALGTPTPYYQWRRNGLNLTDVGTLTGSTGSALSIASLDATNAGNYDVVVTNSFGSVTSLVAVLTVLPPGPPLTITMAVQESADEYWDTANRWSDGQPASASVLSNPHSTYEVLPNAMMRTPPAGGTTTFPGDILQVDGDGVYVGSDGSPTIGLIRFKNGGAPNNNVKVTFPRLVMNGGQLDGSVGTSLLRIAGEMDILANTPLTCGSGAEYEIQSWLTGNGSIEFHPDGVSKGLGILGTSNTFSGTWDVFQGVLVGVGTNSLGTNNITVELNPQPGKLETLYDVYNPSGSLVLNGQMYLHQNDTFRTVTVAGTPLFPGTYTFDELNVAFPLYFPSSWIKTRWSSVNTGSGSITVLSGPAPPQVTLQYEYSASSLQLSWSQGMLLQATNVAGPYEPVPGNPGSPYTVTPTEPQMFFRVLQMQ